MENTPEFTPVTAESSKNEVDDETRRLQDEALRKSIETFNDDAWEEAWKTHEIQK